MWTPSRHRPLSPTFCGAARPVSPLLGFVPSTNGDSQSHAPANPDAIAGKALAVERSRP
jgi:hypothetical protein